MNGDENEVPSIYGHETGHLLGFDDLYYKTADGGPENYEGVYDKEILGKNANNPDVEVTQKDIDAIAKYALKREIKGVVNLSGSDARLRNNSFMKKQPVIKKEEPLINN